MRDSVWLTLSGARVPAMVTYATSDFLPLLGAGPVHGRTFSVADDDVNNPAAVVVLSRAFASRLFPDADAIGRTFTMEKRVFTVIGVIESEFTGIDVSASEVWAPLSMDPREPDPGRPPWYTTADTYLPLIARVTPDADEAVLARAQTVYSRDPIVKRIAWKAG